MPLRRWPPRRRHRLLSLYEGLHVNGWDQADRVPKLLNLAAPVVGRRAGFHRYDAGWLSAEEQQKPVTGKLFPERHRAIGDRPVRLEYPLCEIDSDDANL